MAEFDAGSFIKATESAERRIAHLESTYLPILNKATKGRLDWELSLTGDVECFTTNTKHPAEITEYLARFFSIPTKTQQSGLTANDNTLTMTVPALASAIAKMRTSEKGREWLEKAAKEQATIVSKSSATPALTEVNLHEALKDINLGDITLDGAVADQPVRVSDTAPTKKSSVEIA